MLPDNMKFRQNWRGKLILQIAALRPYNYSPEDGDIAPGGYSLGWRDATFDDLIAHHRAMIAASKEGGK